MFPRYVKSIAKNVKGELKAIIMKTAFHPSSSLNISKKKYIA